MNRQLKDWGVIAANGSASILLRVWDVDQALVGRFSVTIPQVATKLSDCVWSGAGWSDTYFGAEVVSITNGNIYAAPVDTLSVLTTISGERLVSGFVMGISGVDTGQNAVDPFAARVIIGRAFMVGYTPAGTGGDKAEWVVPHDPKDGVTVLTYNLRELIFRIATKSSGTSTVRLEKSGAVSAHAAFGPDISAVNMMTGGDLSLGNGVYDGVNTAWSTPTVQSGDVLRINVIAIGSTDADWSVDLIAEEAA